MSSISDFVGGGSGINGGIPGHVDMRGYISGRYYMPLADMSNVGTGLVGGANLVLYLPFYCVKAHTFSGMAWRYSNGATDAGKKIRLGVYDTANGGPGALVADCGEITIPSVSALLEATASISLGKGMYWLAYLANNSITGANFTPTTTRGIALENGLDAMRVSYSSVSSAPVISNAIYASLAYGALPSTATSPTSVNTSSISPLLYLKG